GYEEIRKSVLEGRSYFGFGKTNFLCAYDDPEVAYQAVAREINRSSRRNPLILIAAGPMQVLGEGIARSKMSKRKYVTLISHGRWNDVHAGKNRERYKPSHEGWAYEEVVGTFSTPAGGSLTCIHIHDQNGRDRDVAGKPLFEGLYANRHRFDWIQSLEMRDKSPYRKGCWDWLYSRFELSAKDRSRNFDMSDAGMLIYVLTGSDYTSPDVLRDLLEHPVVR
ncbi:MAG: hypothetical protein PHV49_01015, partial [Alistipes sp.]|nr:hypothetical protein [Alistipes sp.]